MAGSARGLDLPVPLVGNLEWLAAHCQDVQLGTGREQRFGHRALAVVRTAFAEEVAA
jgi:hypothetical protein